MLSALPPSGRLIGIDRDDDAFAASQRLKRFGERFAAVKGTFEIRRILGELNIDKLNGMLVDLGVSSYQLDNPARGFSITRRPPLDMRMDQNAAFSAYDVVNGCDHGELTRILWNTARKMGFMIASFILEARKAAAEQHLRAGRAHQGRDPERRKAEGGHSGKRTFQAIRVRSTASLRG